MKILQIVTQGEHGGAQVYVKTSSTALVAQGYDVYVATGIQSTGKDQWLFEELSAQGFKPSQLRIVQDLQREVGIWKDIKACMQTYKLVRKIKPDVVHLHSSKAGTVCAVGARLAGAKVVYTVHGFVFNEPMNVLKKYFYIASELLGRFFRNYTVTVSKFDYDTGRKMHIIPRKKGAVIYNGIDESVEKKIVTKKEARKKICDAIGMQFAEDVRIVGVVANLYPAKGLIHLINAAYLARRYKDLHNTIFVVIGEGVLRKELEEEIRDLQLQGIFFLIGSVPNAYKYLKAFDVFVLPSVKEGFPYTLSEVILAKVPFIATSVGGIPEIAQYAASPLVVPGSAKFLTEAIVEFLNRPVVEKKVGVKKFPERLTIHHMVDRLEEVYERVVRG